MKSLTCWFMCLSLISFSTKGYAETQVGLTLVTNSWAASTIEEELLGTEDALVFGGDMGAHFTINPGMGLEEHFQADALIDVYVLKDYEDGLITLNIKQAYIDLLFNDIVGLKAGFIQTDYGFGNNYFHPMNACEFVPEFRLLYPNIFVGTSDMGMPGIPSIRMKLVMPEFVEGLKVSIEQGLLWFDYSKFDENYFLSSMSIMYSDFQIGTVVGYNGYTKPVIGMNAAIGLPLKTYLFWEGVFRQESFRNYIDADNVEDYREDFYMNQSIRLETNWVEPVFRNSMSLYAEYFFYGEGLPEDQYGKIYYFLKNAPVGMVYFENLLIPERNLTHYGTMGLGYMMRQDWNLMYKTVCEFESQLWQHMLLIAKSIGNVSISGAFIMTPEIASRYMIAGGARNFTFNLQIAMDM